MYERMLDKQKIPTEDEIQNHIGKKSVEYVELLRDGLSKMLEIKTELKFPFGKDYGWGYKFSHKSKHLFYLFFEKNSITVTLQINKIKTEKDLERYNKLSAEGKQYWENRYPCGDNGGWVHYRVNNKTQMKDIYLFLSIKTNKEIKL